MEPEMKANQSVGYKLDTEQGRITFHIKGQGPLVLDMGKVHVDNVTRAAYVGMAQVRIVDAAAIGRADKDGNLLSESTRNQMKYDRMVALVLHYETGSAEWSPRHRAEKVDNHAFTIRALAELRGITKEEANGLIDQWATLLNKSRAVVLESFAGRADIGELVRGYREGVTAGIDTDALLSGLSE